MGICLCECLFCKYLLLLRWAYFGNYSTRDEIFDLSIAILVHRFC